MLQVQSAPGSYIMCYVRLLFPTPVRGFSSARVRFSFAVSSPATGSQTRMVLSASMSFCMLGVASCAR